MVNCIPNNGKISDAIDDGGSLGMGYLDHRPPGLAYGR
jgi:hypothetical protein